MKKIMIILLCAGVFIGGWMIYAKGVMPSVELTVNGFHEHYDKKDFGYIYSDLVSEEFRAALPKNIFMDYMNKVYDTVGKIIEVKRGAWGIFYKDVGLTFNVEYTLKNEKAEMREYFTLVKRGKDWKIFIYDPKVKR
ncbi:MAG: hypothetical protein ABIG55_06625 [Candidatus Omnitrophota bacterium]|nr:hypothetical protein [Candidatus Omnitrophota bacterium]